MKRKYTKKECIKALKWYYGFNIKEAENYFKASVSKIEIYELLQFYKEQCKLAFYND